MGNQRLDQGLLISLEGLEAVGKTTQLGRLKMGIETLGQEVVAVREPGGTAFGETLRDLILHRVQAQSGLAEFLVFAAARAELMATVVRPALSRGATVLMDRFVDSSVAYQAFGHGLSRSTVDQVNRIVTESRMPDLTIWLKGPSFAIDEKDQVERRDAAYFERVEAGYQWLYQQNPQRWLVVDSRQNPDIIFDTLMTRIHRFFNGNPRRDD